MESINAVREGAELGQEIIQGDQKVRRLTGPSHQGGKSLCTQSNDSNKSKQISL
jgi:hypothetical protein